jgi:hypothetical protein
VRVAFVRRLPSFERRLLIVLVLLALLGVVSKGLIGFLFPAFPLTDSYSGYFSGNSPAQVDPFGEEWEVRYEGRNVSYSKGPDRIAGTDDDIDLINDWRFKLYMHIRLILLLMAAFIGVFYVFIRLVPVARAPSLEALRTLLLGLLLVIPLWWVCFKNPYLLPTFEEIWSWSPLGDFISIDVSTPHWAGLYAAISIALWSVRRLVAARTAEQEGTAAAEGHSCGVATRPPSVEMGGGDRDGRGS